MDLAWLGVGFLEFLEFDILILSSVCLWVGFVGLLPFRDFVVLALLIDLLCRCGGWLL